MYESRIVVRMSGGLGNQMFQYAFGRSLSLDLGRPLVLDTAYLKKRQDRPFALGKYNLIERVTISETGNLAVLSKIKAIKRIRKWGYMEDLLNWGVLMESFPPSYQVPDIQALSVLKNIHIEGCWQSERYFSHFREVILEDFKLKVVSPVFSDWSEKIRNFGPRSVSLHIRRGDYLSDPAANKCHGVLPVAYYGHAVQMIKKNCESPGFFVFTDDVEWARKNLEFMGKVFYVTGSGCSDPEEIGLMSLCSHHIIANSSFSWWGAWLNSNPGKMVIAPEKWFQSMSSDDIVPNRWIRI